MEAVNESGNSYLVVWVCGLDLDLHPWFFYRVIGQHLAQPPNHESKSPTEGKVNECSQDSCMRFSSKQTGNG